MEWKLNQLEPLSIFVLFLSLNGGVLAFFSSLLLWSLVVFFRSLALLYFYFHFAGVRACVRLCTNGAPVICCALADGKNNKKRSR